MHTYAYPCTLMHTHAHPCVITMISQQNLPFRCDTPTEALGNFFPYDISISIIGQINICIISGDFNIDYRKNSTHSIVSALLRMGFRQFIDTPTHTAGGMIDHLYIYQPHNSTDVIINSALFAPHYSDHFGISVVINKGSNPFIEMPSTLPDDASDMPARRPPPPTPPRPRPPLPTPRRPPAPPPRRPIPTPRRPPQPLPRRS